MLPTLNIASSYNINIVYNNYFINNSLHCELGLPLGWTGIFLFDETAPKIFTTHAHERNSPGSKLLPRRRFPGNFIFNSGKTFLICKILQYNDVNNKLLGNNSH